MSAQRQPTLFIPHGGGPCFWIDGPPPFGKESWENLRQYLSSIKASLPAPPKAFLVVTAHWETAVTTVSTAAQPGMVYDYYGFPPHTYRLQYPASGAPELGRRVRQMIAAAGLPVAEDDHRGFDHGVFVPFLIIDPEAEIPVVMLSLQHDLDPALHVAVGRALAPLREAGVVIVGSGMSYHDLRHFRDRDPGPSKMFDDWLTATVTSSDPTKRDAALIDWDEDPLPAHVIRARSI